MFLFMCFMWLLSVRAIESLSQFKSLTSLSASYPLTLCEKFFGFKDSCD